MRYILVLMSVALLGAVEKPSGNPYAWWCSLNGIMNGDGNHFFLYGRDAWQGQTMMTCRGKSSEQTLAVQVGFFSKQPGAGANALSALRFTMTIWMSTVPTDFIYNSTIPGLLDGSLVHWQAFDSSIEMAGTAWLSSTSPSENSLTLGTLIVRPAAATDSKK